MTSYIFVDANALVSFAQAARLAHPFDQNQQMAFMDKALSVGDTLVITDAIQVESTRGGSNDALLIQKYLQSRINNVDTGVNIVKENTNAGAQLEETNEKRTDLMERI